MTKKLNTDQIQSELAGSAFFPKRESIPEEHTQEVPHVSPSGNEPVPDVIPEEKPDTRSHDTTVSGHHDTTTPRYHDTNDETMIPQPVNEDDIFQIVRKAVRKIGKEPATQRLTLEEKRALRDIEYTYECQGIQTSGNEIIRIATNYLIQEYKRNGEESILAKILKLLNS